MRTEWDYTNLAKAYLKRPDYAQEAINKMLNQANVKPGDEACDVGAGAAHLTLKLAEYGLNVCAIEPNDAMRENGINRTQQYSNVKWYEGIGEDTGMETGRFNIVTFGSSFGVCDRQQALSETKRILKPDGWFACMWNHRDLNDPIQNKIEQLLKNNIPDYDYGTRREDQTQEIVSSKLYKDVVYVEGTVIHDVLADDFIEGWRSHATVYRQSRDRFDKIIGEIQEYVKSLRMEYIKVPYTTRVWMAQVK